MPIQLNPKAARSRSNFAAIRPQIEQVSTGRIACPLRELKKHSKAHIAKLAAGISRYGFVVPMLVDEHYGVISGHARLAAAQLLELAQVPVIRVEHLTDEQLRLFRIFESKIALESEFDEEALNLEFEELRLDNPELSLTDSGFAIAEIDGLAGRAKTRAMDDLDVVVETPRGRPVSRLGDIWLCGRHHLICGDATDPEVLDQLIQGAPIHQVVTDPPYNLPTKAFSSSGQHSDFAMAAGEMDETAFIAFLVQFLTAAKPHLVNGALIYVFMDGKHIAELLAAGRAAGLAQKQLLVWVKSATGAGGMGSFYRSGYELVAVFKHGDGAHQNHIMLGQYGRNRSNVLQYPGVMGMAGGKRALKLHPTVKNVAMIADFMLDASSPANNILDCFGGSGTTLIAADKTERTAFLCEVSPGYVDVTVERFNALGGEPARLAATGQTFAEVRAERLPPATNGEDG